MSALVAAGLILLSPQPDLSSIDALPNKAGKTPPEPVVVTVATPTYQTDGCAIPCSVMECESDGDYLAENSVSSASGAYQIIDGTWAGYGGYSHAADAPPAVQDAKAAELWAGGAGASHWAACL